MTLENVRVVNYLPDENGFLKQENPQPFDYSIGYKFSQSTNSQMAWLRIGFLAAHITYDTMREMVAVDIGSGNNCFVQEASQVFKRIVPYDLKGDSIPKKELYSTSWDIVFLTDVLEHFHRIDELWDLNFHYGFISFPETPKDYDLTKWKHYKPDEHLYFLKQKDFIPWVQRHGYSVVATGCVEDLIRKRWDPGRVNIATVLIEKQ
jgi:hypothetical protein